VKQHVRGRGSLGLACLALLSVTACGTQTYVAADSPGTSPERTAQAASALASLRLQITGDVSERRAGERLVYKILQGTLQKCMSAAGYSYQPPPYEDMYAGFTNEALAEAAGGSGWFLPLDTVDFHINRRDDSTHSKESSNPGFTSLTPKQQGAYLSKLNVCEPDGSLYEFANIPRSAMELDESLEEELQSVAISSQLTGLRKAYLRCVREQALDIAHPAELVESVLESDRATVLRAAAVDAACRQPFYDAGMSRLATVIPEWRAAHAVDLAQVREDWQTIVRRSRA